MDMSMMDLNFEAEPQDYFEAEPILEDNNNPRTSLTADSPYFDKFRDSEIRNLQILSSTLRDISSNARFYSQTGSMMAEATRRLAESCKLESECDMDDETTDTPVDREAKQQAVGPEMAGVLQLLGEVRGKRIAVAYSQPA